MLKTLVILLALSGASPLLEGYSGEPCKRAHELEEQITLLGDQVGVLIEEAKPICARKRESAWAANECTRRLVEIDGFTKQIRELQAERKKALAECAAKP